MVARYERLRRAENPWPSQTAWLVAWESWYEKCNTKIREGTAETIEQLFSFIEGEKGGRQMKQVIIDIREGRSMRRRRRRSAA